MSRGRPNWLSDRYDDRSFSSDDSRSRSFYSNDRNNFLTRQNSRERTYSRGRSPRWEKSSRGRFDNSYRSRARRNFRISNYSRSPDRGNINSTLHGLGLSEAQINTVLNMRSRTDSDVSDTDELEEADKVFDILQSYARLTNHKLNWDSLPYTLSRSLVNFIDCIRLPLFNIQIRDELREATKTFANSIVNSVQYHIFLQTEMLIDDLKNFDWDTTEKAKRAVSKKLKNHYSADRIEEIWQSLHSDLQIHTDYAKTTQTTSGSRHPDMSRSPSPGIDNPLNSDNQTPAAFIPQAENLTVDNTTEISRSSSVFPGRNNTHKTFTEGVTSRKHRASPLTSESNKKANVCFEDGVDLITGNSNIIVHASRGSRATWRLDKVPDNCRILIVGDSNLRSWSIPKKGINVHCFPGAKLSDISSILSNSTFPDTVTALAIAAGVNNFACTSEENRLEMQQILDSIKLSKLDVFFMQIAINKDLSESSIAQLTELNNIARQEFGRNFITLDENRLAFRDTVHYDRRTGNLISSKVYSFL